MVGCSVFFPFHSLCWVTAGTGAGAATVSLWDLGILRERNSPSDTLGGCEGPKRAPPCWQSPHQSIFSDAGAEGLGPQGRRWNSPPPLVQPAKRRLLSQALPITSVKCVLFCNPKDILPWTHQPSREVSLTQSS